MGAAQYPHPDELEKITASDKFLLTELTDEGEIADCYITGAVIEEGSFRFCDVKNCIFSGCRLIGCDFKGSRFSNVIFEKCDLSNSTFEDSNISFSKICETKAVGIQLTGAHMRDVEVTDSNFRYSGFAKAKLNSISFNKTSLDEAFFKNAHRKSSALRTAACVRQISFAHL